MKGDVFMNSKKIIYISLIIIALVILSVILYFSLIQPTLIINHDGSITSTGKNDLIVHLREIKDTESRKNQIDFALEQNLITQEEANSLY